MKKMKRIIALALMLIMAMALTITATAAESTNPFEATIEILNADGATFTYAPIITADKTSVNGWKINSDYMTLFEEFGSTEADIIAALAPNGIPVSDGVLQSKINDLPTSEPMANPQTVNAAGLYLIHGTLEGYEFNPMIAYVSYKMENGKAVGLNSVKLKAKKSEKIVVKKIVEEDPENPQNHYIEIGQEITYQVEARIPYISIDSDTRFTITDELTGGQYKVGEDEKASVKVSLLDEPMKIKPEATANGQKLVIDLTDLTAGNTNANAVVTLTYTVIVTDKIINNIAYPGDYKNEATPVDAYASEITITKYGVAAEGTTAPKLEGAEFVIINADEKYAVIENGMLTAWADAKDDGTKLTTDQDGQITVGGFDRDKNYKVLETLAPDGYSLNNNKVDAEWDSTITVDSKQHAYANVYDTKLVELPFTGGSGTTAFTLFGVLMMISAAGLFYSMKKRS